MCAYDVVYRVCLCVCSVHSTNSSPYRHARTHTHTEQHCVMCTFAKARTLVQRVNLRILCVDTQVIKCALCATIRHYIQAMLVGFFSIVKENEHSNRVCMHVSNIYVRHNNCGTCHHLYVFQPNTDFYFVPVRPQSN